MRIGILTLPLHTNYGGILQAYALQTVLERMGHEVVVVDKRKTYTISLLKMPFVILCRIWRKFAHRENIQLFPEYYERYIFPTTRRKINNFIIKYIHVEPTNDYAQYFNSNPVNAIIVGSDQVWRPCYVDKLEDYFIGFNTETNFKRIAYAASFGVDFWEFDERQSARCSELLKRFDAVSVREETGVVLCRQYLNTEALHVLDPTMLLNKNDYFNVMNKDHLSSKKSNMFCYILDNSERKSKILASAAKALNQKPFFIKEQKENSIKNFLIHKDKCVIPGVDEWLQSFENAETIFTDSFHGCVFSIIFHKPFWVVINPQRGSARFNSLLAMLHLKDRVISTDNVYKKDWHKPIDWCKVDDNLEKMQRISLEFLANSLN